MQAKLYQGEKASITGKVVHDDNIDYKKDSDYHAIEIKNSDGTFLIYYNPVQFEKIFKVGKGYTFYGYIRFNDENFDGGLYAEGYNTK